MGTDVSKTTNNLPTINEEVPDGLENVSGIHLQNRWLTLLHATSTALSNNDNLKPGHIVDSSTFEIVGGRGKAFEIFFTYFIGAFWLESRKDAPKEPPHKYPLNAGNERQPWDDGNIKRKHSFEFHALPKGGAGMPYLITFSGASAKTAKSILTTLTNTRTSLYGCYFSVDSASKTGKAAGNPVWYLTARPTDKTTESDYAIGKSWKAKTAAIADKLAAVHSEDASADDGEKVPF